MPIIKLGLDCPRGSIVFGLLRRWGEQKDPGWWVCSFLEFLQPSPSQCDDHIINHMRQSQKYFTDDGQNATSGKKILSKKATDNMGCSSREKNVSDLARLCKIRKYGRNVGYLHEMHAGSPCTLLSTIIGRYFPWALLLLLHATSWQGDISFLSPVNDHVDIICYESFPRADTFCNGHTCSQLQSFTFAVCGFHPCVDWHPDITSHLFAEPDAAVWILRYRIAFLPPSPYYSA